MGLDLASTWMLSFFGACAAGGAVGFLLAKLIDFEFGLGAGLLIPGIVSLHFTFQFVTEYLDFRDAPSQASGTVVAIEDRPANQSGDVTTPVAIVEFTASDGAAHRVASKGGSGLHEGDVVTVVYDASHPERAKVGKASEFFGGAIASGLFGTFPASAGLFFLLGWLSDQWPRKRSRAETERATGMSRLVTAANLLILGGLFGAGLWNGSVAEQILIAFGVTSLGLWIYVVDGVRRRRDAKWTLGVGVLAVNFSAWVVALWLLLGNESQW
jgi:hypothetical protein